MRSATAVAIVAVAMAVGVALFLAIPVAGLVIRAFQSGLFFEFASSDATLEALRLSMITASITLLISVIGGTPLAFILSVKKWRFRWIVDAVIVLPIVMPPTVAGVALLSVFGRRGLIGEPLADIFGIGLGFSTVAVVMAQTLVAAPFYIQTVKSGFDSLDKQQMDVAATLGASKLKTFVRIAVPQATISLLAGAALCWTRAVGELGATLIFAGNLQNTTRTTPLAILTALESAEFGLNGAISISVTLLGTALGAILILRLMPVLLQRGAK